MSYMGALGNQNTRSSGARGKAQWLDAHAAGPEALGVGPSTHRWLTILTPDPGDPTPSRILAS